MRTTAFIKKEILPLYKKCGYTYQCLSSGDHRFLDPEEIIDIYYQINTSVFRKIIKEVTLVLCFRCGNYHMAISPQSLIDISLSQGYYVCKDDREFETAIFQLTDLVFQVIFPRLRKLHDAIVPMDLKYYEILSKAPEQQAQIFAEKNNIELQYSANTCDWATHWLKSRIPKEYVLRKPRFEQSIEEIIPFAAYCGEIVRKATGGQWEWVELDSTTKVFAVPFPNLDDDEIDGYNSLYVIVNYWNFSQDIKDYSIFPRILNEWIKQ